MSLQYFDFLRLPRELRDQIYEHTLCSFTPDHDQYDIEQCSAVYTNKKLEIRRFTGNLNLLLANKQVHDEGYKCMFVKNQFVFVRADHHLPSRIYGHMPPIFFLSEPNIWGPKKMGSMSDYPWYVMRLDIGKRLIRRDDPSKWKNRPGVFMLWEDCIDMLRRFGCYSTDFVGSGNRLVDGGPRRKIRAKLAIDVFPKKKEWGRKDSYTDLWISHFAADQREVLQRRLLGRIKDGLCDHQDLEIRGCDDTVFAAEVIQEVAKVSFMSLVSFRSHLDDHAHKAEASWAQGDIQECANFCAQGIEIIHRVLHNTPVLHRLHEDGLKKCPQVARSSYALHVLLARCIHAHLSTLFSPDAEPKRYKHIAEISTNLKILFQMHHSGVRGILPPQHLSADEEAEEYYMRAKGLRVWAEYHKPNLQDDIVDYIERATRLCPGNVVYEEEERKIKAWIPEYREHEGMSGNYFPMMARWRKDVLRTKFEY